MKNILALDFDGVICHSITECILVSYNAYSKIFLKKCSYLTKKEDIEPIRFEKFSKLRPYVKKGWEYVILHKIIDENIRINDQKEYIRFIKKFKSKEIEQVFYEERMRFKEQNPSEWFNANPCYPMVIEGLKKTEKDIYIVTTKKKEYTSAILRFNKVKIKKDNILTTFFKRNKKDLLFYIAKKEGVKPKDIIFIEDQIENLIKIKNSGIPCYLAQWGYVNTEQLIEAKRKNINAITEKEFIHFL